MQITLRIVGYHFSSRLTATLNLCLIYIKITWALAILLEHMHKKFEINRTKIKGSCQSGRKVVPHNSKNDLPLPLVRNHILTQNLTAIWNFFFPKGKPLRIVVYHFSSRLTATLIFFRFISNLCMCSNSMASVHAILK